MNFSLVVACHFGAQRPFCPWQFFCSLLAAHTDVVALEKPNYKLRMDDSVFVSSLAYLDFMSL